jgi:hypothetical protein
MTGGQTMRPSRRRDTHSCRFSGSSRPTATGSLLTWPVAGCRKDAASTFVSRNASLPTDAVLSYRCDLGIQGYRARNAVIAENVQSRLKTYRRNSVGECPLTAVRLPHCVNIDVFTDGGNCVRLS